MSNTRREVFLDEMGVAPLWVRRDVAAAPAVDLPHTEMEQIASDPLVGVVDQQIVAVEPSILKVHDDDSSANPVESMNWIQLKAAVSSCMQCGLCKKRTNTVFGVGDEKAKWLFIGEGPGRNEDAQGEPFVGPAGKLLDNMLLSLGLKRGENAYIANIVKCRPTDPSGKDRPPTQEESDACMPYLQRQIALIQPTVIVALGKTAALSLLKRDPDTAVSSLRGKVHEFAGLPLIVTYHPAYLLRNLVDKRKSWADLCLAAKAFSGTSGG